MKPVPAATVDGSGVQLLHPVTAPLFTQAVDVGVVATHVSFVPVDALVEVAETI